MTQLSLASSVIWQFYSYWLARWRTRQPEMYLPFVGRLVRPLGLGLPRVAACGARAFVGAGEEQLGRALSKSDVI